jgi:hypothetical protein
MLNIPAGSTGRMTKQRPPQAEKSVQRKEAPQTKKPAAERVKRERTRTKRISE